jgi:predicted metal-dependent HD superfamily phosphohydrolase
VAQAVVPPRLISLLSGWDANPETVEAVAADVVARYRQPHRRYHNLEHIDEMLAVTDRLGASHEVECAVWFHDAIYDPATSDNEERSAHYAHGVLESLSAPADFVNEVARLVLSTIEHAPEPDDSSATVLADADLAILGASPARYERYVRDVRAEYGHLTDEVWREGRAAVVRAFLDRRRLFYDDALHAELDARARDNLRAELVALSAS